MFWWNEAVEVIEVVEAVDVIEAADDLRTGPEITTENASNTPQSIQPICPNRQLFVSQDWTLL